jgi:hypothetical protein
MTEMKGIQGLRLYYFDGIKKEELPPPSEVFCNNSYKNLEIPDISILHM